MATKTKKPKIEYFSGTIDGFWRTADPGRGHLACWLDRDTEPYRIGLLAVSSAVAFRNGMALALAAYRSGTFADHDVYTAKCAAELRGEDALVETLCGGTAKGRADARLVVDELGELAIVRICSDLRVLDKVKGLSPDGKDLILAQLARYATGPAGIVLRFEGIDTKQAEDLYDVYGDEAEKILRRNPYQIAYDVPKGWAKSFETVDRIALANGVGEGSDLRLRAAACHAAHFSAIADGGTCFCMADRRWPEFISAQAKAWTGGRGEITPAFCEDTIRTAPRRFLVDSVRGMDYCWPSRLGGAEASLVGGISERRRMPIPEGAGGANLLARVQLYEKITGFPLGGDQAMAAIAAIRSPFAVITGGPGSGKTHVMGALIYLWHATAQATHASYESTRCILAAPTGKAAKRMSESLSAVEASLRKHVEKQERRGGTAPYGTMSRFTENTGVPRTIASILAGTQEASRERGLLVVDEGTMAGLRDLSDLLALYPRFRVVVIGDVDQLPSIEPGQVFRDLCLQERVPNGAVTVLRLTGNYRSRSAATLTANCLAIRDGRGIRSMDLSTDSFRAFDPGSDRPAADMLVAEYKRLILDGWKEKDVRVISPVKADPALGTEALNLRLREIANPACGGPLGSGHFRTEPGYEIKAFRKRGAGWRFRIGDRVVQTRNDKDLGVVNGDTGTIISANEPPRGSGEAWTMTVRLDDASFGKSEIEYKADDVDSLELAYATTVHKMQGSEAPIVLMAVPYRMNWLQPTFANRNLLYTGVTRAKNRACLYGSYAAMDRMIGNVLPTRRSVLACRIAEIGQ